MKVKNIGRRPIYLFGTRIEPGEIQEVNASKENIIKTDLRIQIIEEKKKIEEKAKSPRYEARIKK